MKKILYVFLLACVVCSCAFDGPDKPGDEVHDYLKKLTSSEMQGALSADTITPPSNPLAPREENTYTIAGVLIVSYDNHPAVRTLQNGHHYYVLDKYKKYMRFDHPILQGLTIGDTIGVTGELYKDKELFIIPSEIAVISTYQGNQQ